MSHYIHILPDDKFIQTEQCDSILESALKAGVGMDYNCSNGNCGLCKVRLLSGDVEKIRNFDFVIPETEKQQNYILSCCNAARSDIEIEAVVAHGSSDIQVQTLDAKIKKLEHVGDDLMVLHLKTPRSKRLRFLGGQYVNLYKDGVETYQAAIASCPCEDMRLELHIRYLSGEPFSHYIFEQARVGQNILVEGPHGNFVLEENSNRPLLLIAFDTGFAAIKSLMEHANALDEEREVYFYWITCNQDKPYMHNLCRSLEDALDHFHYRHLSLKADYHDVAKQLPDTLEQCKHFLSEIIKDIPDVSTYDAFIAAPLMIKKSVREMLKQHGLTNDHIKIEPVHGNKDISCLS